MTRCSDFVRRRLAADSAVEPGPDGERSILLLLLPSHSHLYLAFCNSRKAGRARAPHRGCTLQPALSLSLARARAAQGAGGLLGL